MEAKNYTPTRNILVTVDVQRDFIDGTLAVKNGLEVVAPLNRVARAVRAKMGNVAFTRDWHPASTPHFDTWPVHCVAGSEGAEFDPALEIEPDDVILDKGTGQTDGYSGIEGVSADGKTLETLTAPRGWENVAVYIGGLATDYCVKATAVDMGRLYAHHPSVAVYALRDAMRAVNLDPADEAAAVAEMAEAGVTFVSVERALAMIDESRVER